MWAWTRLGVCGWARGAHLSLPALQAVCRSTGCRLHVGREENATLGLLHRLMFVFCFAACC